MINLKSRKFFHRSGFASLISVLLISFLLLSLVSASSFEGFNSLSGVFYRENKEISYNMALSCLDQAFLRIVQSPSWRPNEFNREIFIGGFSCLIKNVEVNNQKVTVISESEVGESVTSLLGVFDQETFEIIYIRELPEIPFD